VVSPVRFWPSPSHSRYGSDTPNPAFKLRTYVHLMDDGVGDAAFMDEVFTTSREERQASEKRRATARGAIPSG
jgi:hypothetical protein